jgi:hypothetical protein
MINNLILLLTSTLILFLMLVSCREESVTDAPDGDCTSLIRVASIRGECTETLSLIAQFR